MEVTGKVITISTFVNPHLFWILEPHNEERIKYLKHINQLMLNEYKSIKSLSNDLYEIGELVAVSIDNKYYRAIIKNIENENVNTQNRNMYSYLCWLMDYGTMYETSTVCKLPSSLQKLTPLALQASLNNVTYVQQQLSYDQFAQPIKISKPTTVPSSVAHQVSLELMSNLNDIQFVVENKSDDILFGDILYRENDDLKSLRQTLVDREILTINEALFEEIKQNIHAYREAHGLSIAQICKKMNSIQHLKETKDNLCWKKVISKYLKEYEDSELFDDMVELSGPLHIRRSRSRNTQNDSCNSINSGNESMSDIDTSETSKTFKEKSPGNMSRVKALIEKMKQKQSEKAKCGSSFEDDYEDKLSDKVESGTPEINLNEGACKEVEACKEEKTNVQSRKRVLPSNVVLIPSGANLNSFHKKNEAKSVANNDLPTTSKIPSEEELSSDCKRVKINYVNEDNNADTTSSDERCTNKEKEVEQKDIGIHVNTLKVKPFCSCKQCFHWTHDSDWNTDTNFVNECEQLKHLTVNKPPPLFLTEDQMEESTNRNIIALNYSSGTKLQKQIAPKLLLHSEYSQAFVKLVCDIYFHEHIHRSLRQLQYKEAKRIQMYTWPAMLRMQHVFMISGSQSGKTMAYLPVILTFLLEKNERYGPFGLKSGGPIVIILCRNTKKCEDIYDLSKVLLGTNKLKMSLITYPLAHINTKHLDMLITTPAILMDLLKTRAINFKRLCHLILEDGDNILKLESEIMKNVFSLAQSVISNRVCPKSIQLIICAEHWNLHLENLMAKLQSLPLICIGNYLEAALYGKMQFSMRFVNSACKEHELKNLLKDKFKVCKSIILCTNEEIPDVQTILMLKGIEATIISEDLSKEEILYLEEVWTQCKGGEYTVLVCTDFIFNSLLTVTSASLLIHYSLPNSWTQFVKRFGCLLEHCKSPFAGEKIKDQCQSVVLCDEKCNEHMSKFFNFIDSTELRNQLPEILKNFAKDLKYAKEQDKLDKKIVLCDTLKLFGMCFAIKCPWRHIVDNNLDILDYLPQSGKIKFKIVHIRDVTTFAVQLIQHIDMQNNVHEFEDSATLSDLTNVLKISRKQVLKPVVGQIYAYYDIDESDGVYYRCDLLEINSDLLKILLIDKGDIVNTMKTRLYDLPKEFQKKPRRIVEVYLANIIPPYCDENFSAKSFFNLKNILEKHDYKKMIFAGDIHLQLGNTLWLKNVYEEIVLSENVIPGFQLTKEILVWKLAEYNNYQLNNLYKLCKEASITLPIYEKPVKQVIKEENRVVEQWAHFDSNVNEVTFSAAISPDEIYVKLKKFNQQLCSLQKEIQESLKKPNYPTLQNVEIGTICLAKDIEDDEYGRIIVKRTENGKALCFFVDYGDEAVVDITDLKYIHNKFITQLPFQSIQCRLYGIKPVLDEWQNDVTDILYEYATEPHSNIFRLLYVKVCDKEINSLHKKQNRYSILLKDGYGEKRTLINSLLIDCGLAIPNMEKLEDFEIPTPVSDTEESDEELENIIDICKKTKEVEENSVQGIPTSELNEDMELVLINPEEFFKSILAPKEVNNLSSSCELPAIQAAPQVDYCTPEVYWSQTEKVVKIDIKLHDIEKYSVNLVKGTILHFKTVKNEKTYKLNIVLYQKVKSIQHTSMGLQVRVTLTKTNDIEWPRLTLSKQRMRNIHYDISTITVKEDNRRILEFPKMPDDDESDDDKIDIMYHVDSDLDSDFDAEMAHDSS